MNDVLLDSYILPLKESYHGKDAYSYFLYQYMHFCLFCLKGIIGIILNHDNSY